MSFPSDMTAPPAGAMEACLALVEKATPGEWHCFAGIGKARATVHSERGHIAFCTMRGPSGAVAGLDRPEMEANAAVIAASVNLLRTHGPALLAALRLREGCEGLVDSLPSNWCDPMLTGPTAVIGKPPYGCPEIEALIAAIKQRLRDDLARVLEEGE